MGFDFDQKPELNITPLVDVMLVLLAILMVTTPVIEYEEQINLPKGSSSKRVQSIKKINILITLDKKVYINKKPYQFNTFADNFELWSKDKSRNIPVYIRGDKALKYEDIMYILKSVKEVGFLKVALVSD